MRRVAAPIAVVSKRERNTQSLPVLRRPTKEQVAFMVEGDSGDGEAVEACQRRYDNPILKRTLQATKSITTKSGLQSTTEYLINKANDAFGIEEHSPCGRRSELCRFTSGVPDSHFGSRCRHYANSIAQPLCVHREVHQDGR